MSTSSDTEVWRAPRVIAESGFGGISTLYHVIATQGFPKQIKIGARSVGWRACEVRAWIEARTRERDEKILKNLKDKPKTNDDRGTVARELIRKVAQSKTDW
jgi:predicted DNA-binding transcriptional regulator AlpA